MRLNLFKQNNSNLDSTPSNYIECPSTSNTCSVSWENNEAGNYWFSMEFKTTYFNTLAQNQKITVGSLTLKGDASSRASNPIILKQTAVVSRYRIHKLYFSAATMLTISLPYTSALQKGFYLQKSGDPNGPSGTTITDTIVAFKEDNNTKEITQISRLSTSPLDSSPNANTGTVTWTFDV